MKRFIVAVFTALVMVLSLSAVPAHAQTGGNHECFSTKGVTVCTYVKWYHSDAWIPSTVRVDSIRVSVTGDVEGLESTRSVVVNDLAIHSISGAKYWGTVDFSLSHNNRSHTVYPNDLVNKSAFVRYEWRVRKDLGTDSNGVAFVDVD